MLLRHLIARPQHVMLRRLPTLLPNDITRDRSIFVATIPLLQKKSMVVPTMGDSITEGTIVDWIAQVGQAVKDGDVVAMIETDKVTVEIKAVLDGVISQHFGKVDDTVEVGAPLYEIDTDGVATSDAGVLATEPIPTQAAPAPMSAKSASETLPAPPVVSSDGLRTPSIRFLGKDGWQQRLTGAASVELVTHASTQLPNSAGHATTVLETFALSPSYGRPVFTEEEMEALMMGGASIAPKLISPSGGAKFRY